MLYNLESKLYERKQNLPKRIFINLERFQSDCKARNFNITTNISRFFAIYFLLFFFFLLFLVNELDLGYRAMICEC